MFSASVQRITLPNGQNVCASSKAQGELRLIYHEVFEDQIYTRSPIVLADGDTIFDVGANIGMFSLFVSQKYSRARIFAFEPLPPNFTFLQKNCGSIEGIKLFPHGLTRIAGEARATFIFYPRLPGSSTMYPKEEPGRLPFSDLFGVRRWRAEKMYWKEFKRFFGNKLYFAFIALYPFRWRLVTWFFFSGKAFACELKTLSETIRSENVERIDLLKIDVEGSEIDVLLGIDDQDWSKIRQIVLEVDDRGNYLARIAEIQNLLCAKGMDVELQNNILYAVRGEDVSHPAGQDGTESEGERKR